MAEAAEPGLRPSRVRCLAGNGRAPAWPMRGTSQSVWERPSPSLAMRLISPFRCRSFLAPPPRTAPLPLLRTCAQPRRHRVVPDMRHHCPQMRIAADEPVPVIAHPERLARDSQRQPAVVRQRPAPAVRLPRLHDASQGDARFDQHVDVVRHDAPRVQDITAVVFTHFERRLHHCGHRRMRERPAAVARIQPLVEALAPDPTRLAFRQLTKIPREFLGWKCDVRRT